MPGQRKRTAVASTSEEVTSKRKKKDAAPRVLRTVLQSAGIALKEDPSANAPVELNCDQVTLTRTLADELTQSKVDEFMKDFHDVIKDTECVKDVIQPTRYSADSGLSTRPGGQDSVVRLLLGVEVLQPKLVDCLLEKVVSFLNDDDELALLLVSQLKWLDRVVEGEVLCKKLIEVLSVASGGAKRAMIIMLPEILEDAQHHEAATELKERLNDEPELVPAVVQCLGNLNLTRQDLMAEVLETALGALQSVNVADIPVLMRFIIQSTQTKDMPFVVRELRENLDCFTTFEPPKFTSTQEQEKGHKAMPDEVAILETLQFLICFQKSVADAWMKAIQGVSTASGHQVVDILVLFILYTLPARKKAVVNLLVTKIKKKQFTEDLLGRVFSIGSSTLKEYFPCILSFAGSLLRYPSAPVVSFASAIYQNAFKCFDVFSRQEIVGAVVTHVGSGLPSEVDAAFNVLLSLVKADVDGMRRFDVFIKGMLDYLEKLSMPQIRKLYTIISSLAQDEDSALWDEMCTIIGKQLSHTDRQFRHIGVIGGVMMVTQLAQKMDSEPKLLSNEAFPSTSAPHRDVLASSRLQSAKALLDQVMLDGCMRSADSTTLFNDEMAQAVLRGTLDPDFIQLLSTRSTDTLEEIYLIESTESLPSDMAVSLEYNAGLDSIDSCSVALNLVPLVLRQHDQLKRGEADRSSVMCLRSHFHLLRACVATMGDGSLSDIDALLGCPVVMCAAQCLLPDSFKSLQGSVRECVCLSLFLCLNWYLESLCAFAGTDDPDMQWKVLKRLQNVTEVEAQLETCMAATPSFVVFLHHVLGLEVELSAGSTYGLPGSGRKKGGKARQPKGSKSINVTMAALDNTTAETTLEMSMVDRAQPLSSLEAVRPFYRPLTVAVYEVLSYEPIQRECSQGSVPTQTPHVNEVAELEPPQIVFLLNSFLARVLSSLSLFGTKRGRPHSKSTPSSSQLDGGHTPAAVAQLAVTLLPAFCCHLESASAFFQGQKEENDGIEDMYELGGPEAQAHSTILSTTFKIISTVLGWSHLTEEDNVHLVEKTCKVFANRLGSDNASKQESLFEQGLLYLKGFASSVPTVTTAQALIKCLVNLCRLSPAQEEHRTAVAAVAHSLLKKPWTESGSTQQQKEAIGTILKFYISWSKDPLQQIETVIRDNFMAQVEKEVTEEEEEEEEEEKEESQQTFGTFSVKTMSCYYQTCMSALVDTVKGELAHKDYATSPAAMDQGMVVLSVSVRLLQMLINLVKTTEKRPILGAALKHGRQFIEAFVRYGIPLLNVAFRTKQEEVLAVLKSLQQSTRSLQHFCGHSKVQRDIALTNSVPALKRSLETLLFKVKSVLADHNCQEAFWVGNLKNRDLRGQEVLSQQPTQDSPPETDDDVASVLSGSGAAEEQDEVILSSEDDD